MIDRCYIDFDIKNTIIKNFLKRKLEECKNKTHSNKFQKIRYFSEKRFLQEELNRL
jgi:hypothetical protein